MNRVPSGVGGWRRTGRRILITGLLLAVMLGTASFAAGSGAAHACSEMLQDGSFANASGWQSQSKGGYALISDYLSRSGAQAAHLGGTNDAQDQLKTVVTLPQGSSATLSFWWQIHSEESAEGADGLNLFVESAQGLSSLITLSDRNATSLWKQSTVDLSAFSGQTITLTFSAQTDPTRVTDFFIDDLSLSACSQASLQPRLFLPWSAR